MELVQSANTLFATLTFIAQVGFVILVLFWITKTGKGITEFIEKNGLLFAFLIALGGVIGSYFYSNVAGFQPCSLCWYQRIFLFPQVIILGIAAWKQDRHGAYYSLILSVLGSLIAIYNSYLQFGGSEIFPCSAAGPSCAQRFVFEFGYITIPLMSLTAFALMAFFEFSYLRRTRNSI